MHIFTKSFIAGKPTLDSREKGIALSGARGQLDREAWRGDSCQWRVGREGRKCASRSSKIECCFFWVISRPVSILPSHVQDWSSSSGLLSRGGTPPLP